MNATDAGAIAYNVFLSGGIPLTLAINFTVCVLLVFSFIICVRRLPLYNTKQKQELLSEQQEEEPRQHSIVPLVGSQWITIPTNSTANERENKIRRINNVDMRKGKTNASSNDNSILSGLAILQSLFCCLCCPNREAKRATKDVSIYTTY
jgi:hypothetical protein